MLLKDFACTLIKWQKQHGRNDLPWQVPDPYARWISEVMLQQTQVATVKSYYRSFLSRFPTVKALAEASEDEVMALWAGLGYYSRARNLHRAAKEIVQKYQGVFPQSRHEWESLPGIGRSTAAAIVAFSFGAKETILDGNVKRLLARLFAIEQPLESAAAQKKLWALAESLLPDEQLDRYIQGLMDLGATVCTRSPSCLLCPFCDACKARQLGLENKLPLPKVRKERPQKEATVLLFWYEDEFFVVRRRQKGVWQGLFSLPEFGLLSDEEQVTEIGKRWGLAVQNCRPMETVVHDFSHYRLLIYPLAVKVKAKCAEDSDRLWVSYPNMQTVGLPAPIAGIVRAFFQS